MSPRILDLAVSQLADAVARALTDRDVAAELLADGVPVTDHSRLLAYLVEAKRQTMVAEINGLKTQRGRGRPPNSRFQNAITVAAYQAQSRAGRTDDKAKGAVVRQLGTTRGSVKTALEFASRAAAGGDVEFLRLIDLAAHVLPSALAQASSLQAAANSERRARRHVSPLIENDGFSARRAG